MIATVNIKVALAILLIFGAMALVLAILVINTLAPVRATPAVPAPPAAANIPPAPAPQAMSGTAAAARNKFSTALKVICFTAMVQ